MVNGTHAALAGTYPAAAAIAALVPFFLVNNILLPFMGLNAAANILTPLCLAAGITAFYCTV